MGRHAEVLLEVWRALRAGHVDERLARSHLGWIQRYLLYWRGRNPWQLGVAETLAFLTHLEVDLHLGPAQRRQALAALDQLCAVTVGPARRLRAPGLNRP